jgi:hypothetical protein
MRLTLDEQTTKKILNDKDVPKWFKTVLTDLFDNKSNPTKVWDYKDIKSMDDVYRVLEVDPSTIFNSNDSDDEIAYKQAKLFIKAINPINWIPDWSDLNQKKWRPWFNLSSGFSFSHTYYYYDLTNAYGGSRLCFESEERCIHAAKYFLDIYEKLIK